VTDALHVIGETLAEAYGGEYLPKRFYDMLRPMAEGEQGSDTIVKNILEQICVSGGEIF
jgi:hypothetical protein